MDTRKEIEFVLEEKGIKVSTEGTINSLVNIFDNALIDHGFWEILDEVLRDASLEEECLPTSSVKKEQVQKKGQLKTAPSINQKVIALTVIEIGKEGKAKNLYFADLLEDLAPLNLYDQIADIVRALRRYEFFDASYYNDGIRCFYTCLDTGVLEAQIEQAMKDGLIPFGYNNYSRKGEL